MYKYIAYVVNIRSYYSSDCHDKLLHMKIGFPTNQPVDTVIEDLFFHVSSRFLIDLT